MTNFFYKYFFTFSWIVTCFLIVLLFSLYFHIVGYKKFIYQELQKKQKSLQQKKESLLEEGELLREKIRHHNDHDWIQCVLMKKLGLVPKGQKKIVFQER